GKLSAVHAGHRQRLAAARGGVARPSGRSGLGGGRGYDVGDRLGGGSMTRGEVIVGRLASGIGHGAPFTRLGWARRQVIEKLGIDPFPGTVNLILEDSRYQPAWERLKREPGVRIANTEPGACDCDARCYPISIEGRIDAAIVIPEISGYSPNLVEIIATTRI